MTDKEFTYTFRLVNQQTGFIICKYQEDEFLLNEIYSSLLLELPDNEKMSIVNYLTQLIGYLITKEDYEYCAKLLTLKTNVLNIL